MLASGEEICYNVAITKDEENAHMREEIYAFTPESEDAPFTPSLVGISYCDGSYRISRPSSPLFCVEYILSGTGTVFLDGREHHPRAGDTYFLPAGHDHLYYADQSDPWEKIWLNFSGPLAEALTAAYGVGEVCCFKGLYTGDLLRSMLRLASERKENSTLAVSLLLHELFHRMHNASASKCCDPIAAALRDFMDLHCEEEITVTDLADAVGKSPSQCARIFRRAYGIPPYRYLLDRRIALAKTLLSETAMTVAAISRRLSFCDEYYFSNLFKEKVGVSPAAYRARART